MIVDKAGKTTQKADWSTALHGPFLGPFCWRRSNHRGAIAASARPWSLWCSRAMPTILVVCVLGGCHLLFAQQDSQTPSQSTPSQAPSPQTQPDQPPAKSASGSGTQPSTPTSDSNVPKNDRIFYALPNYLTVENATSLPPLTVGQKFKLVAEGTFDPLEFAFLALVAGVNQASNTNPTFG